METTVEDDKKVVLLDSQTDHFLDLIRVLMTYHLVVDTSVMGAGKTVMSIAVAQKFGMKLFIVAPNSAISVWERHCDRYGIDEDNRFIISYTSLASKTGYQPGHGYLKREDREIITDEFDRYGNLIQIKTIDTSFTPTDKLHEAVKTGTLFIFDEAQNMKNRSQKTLACTALVDRLLYQGCEKSRCLLLSGTLVDKEEHSINIMRLAGFAPNKELYVYNRSAKVLQLTGLHDMIRMFTRFWPEDTKRFLNLTPLPQRVEEVAPFIFQLFVQVFKTHLIRAMSMKSVEIDIKNGFYDVDAEDRAQLAKVVKGIAITLGYDEHTGGLKNSFCDLTKEWMAVEWLKRDVFINCIRATLKAKPKAKVVMFINYLDTLTYLEFALKKHRIMFTTVDGTVVGRDRVKAYDKFNRNKSCSVLLATPGTTACAVSLDDTVGDAPRYTFISPTYNIQNEMQCVGRTARQTTKSLVTVRLVYVKECKLELGVINALARKGMNMKQVLDVQVKDGWKFPSDYENEVN